MNSIQVSEVIKFSPIIFTITNSIFSTIYFIVEYISIILIFKKADDEGIVNYIPVLNNLKLFWRTKVLNTYIFAILLLILGPSIIGIGITALGTNPFTGLVSVLSGSFLLVLSIVLFIITSINHVKNLEENPSIMSYISCMFFQPFYYIYMAFSKKSVAFTPSTQQKVKGSCVLGCLGIIIVLFIIIGVAILIGANVFCAMPK